MWVSTSTGTISPLRDPEAISRVVRAREAAPETATTGPSRCTSDVR